MQMAQISATARAIDSVPPARSLLFLICINEIPERILGEFASSIPSLKAQWGYSCPPRLPRGALFQQVTDATTRIVFCE